MVIQVLWRKFVEKKDMENKNELVKKYYKFPFAQYSSYIFDSEQNMCLMYTAKIDNESKSRFLSVLNGERGIVFNSNKKAFSILNGVILFGYLEFMIVRGWGRLQYIKTDDPELIQDTFGQWVVDTLNNYHIQD